MPTRIGIGPAVAALERHDLGGPEGVADDGLAAARAGAEDLEVRRLAFLGRERRGRGEEHLQTRRQAGLRALLPDDQAACTDEKRRDYEQSLQDPPPVKEL